MRILRARTRLAKGLTGLALISTLAVPAVAAAGPSQHSESGAVEYSQHPESDVVVINPDTDRNRRTSDREADRLLGDNFTLNAATTIRTVEWWGWYSPQDFSVDYLDDFTLEIYRIEGSAPGNEPIYSRHLGDIVENAVPSPFGGYLGDSPLVPHWSVIPDPSNPLEIHRYLADLWEEPIGLEAGEYLISIANDMPQQGSYFLGGDPEFIGTGVFSGWNWHRAQRHEPGVDGFTWAKTSLGVWAAECTGTPCGAGDDVIRDPDLSFQLYEGRLGLEIVTGTAEPILYTVESSGLVFVSRVSNVRVGDAVYDVNFRLNFPSVVFGGETDFDFDGATAAADALNAILNAAVPVPSRTQSTINRETPVGLQARAYSIPFARVGPDTIAVESSGPALPDIPPTSSTWRRTLDASDTANQKLSLADFSLLDGHVEPFELGSGDLIAGGGNAKSAVTVGSVRAVTPDGRSFSVTYQITQPGWCLTEVHAHVADTVGEVPQTHSGNPKVGQFAYSDANLGCRTEYTFPAISLGTLAGSFAVPAHAMVERQMGDLTLTETAWAKGTPFPGRGWATYMETGRE